MTISNEEVQENATNKKKKGNGRYSPTHLSFFHGALLIFIANTILIGNLSCCKFFKHHKMKNMTTVYFPI
jgi:hypothetical protein